MWCLKVSHREGEWWIDLPQLTSIRLGRNAFFFDWDNSKSGILIMKSEIVYNGSWIDLSKLAVLTTEGDTDDNSSFTNPNIIDIESSTYWATWWIDLPKLTTVILTKSAFKNQKEVTTKSRSVGFRSFIDIGVLARYFKSGLPFFQNGNFIIWFSVYCDKYRVDGDYVKTGTAHKPPYYGIRQKPSEHDCSVWDKTPIQQTPHHVKWIHTLSSLSHKQYYNAHVHQ